MLAIRTVVLQLADPFAPEFFRALDLIGRAIADERVNRRRMSLERQREIVTLAARKRKARMRVIAFDRQARVGSQVKDGWTVDAEDHVVAHFESRDLRREVGTRCVFGDDRNASFDAFDDASLSNQRSRESRRKN